MSVIREQMLKWRRGDSALDEWAAWQVSSGDLDVWLDPVLPMYAMARPDLYQSALYEGAIAAGMKVARGEHLNEPRLLVRTEDSYAFLREYLQYRWERALRDPLPNDYCSQVYEKALYAIYPWEMPYTEENDRYLTPAAGAALVTDSWEFLQYTRDMLRLLRKLGVPFVGKIPRRGTKEGIEAPKLLEELAEWAKLPLSAAHRWSHVFQDRVIKERHPLIRNYFSFTCGLVEYAYGNEGVGDAQYRSVVAEELALFEKRYPTCPLLAYLPERDRYTYDEYAEVEVPKQFTYEDRSQEIMP